MAVYGTQRKSAGTVPAQSPRAPSSFKIVVAHCTMPRYLPPRHPANGFHLDLHPDLDDVERGDDDA